MSQTAIRAAVAAYLAKGGVVTQCPARTAWGALRASAVKHMAS